MLTDQWLIGLTFVYLLLRFIITATYNGYLNFRWSFDWNGLLDNLSLLKLKPLVVLFIPFDVDGNRLARHLFWRAYAILKVYKDAPRILLLICNYNAFLDSIIFLKEVFLDVIVNMIARSAHVRALVYT